MQIVAVSGKYSVPVLLNEKLMAKKYQDVYVDLSSASERDSRITIEDLRCDGLPAIASRTPRTMRGSRAPRASSSTSTGRSRS